LLGDDHSLAPIPGLDPGTQPFRRCTAWLLVGRVKPGHEESRMGQALTPILRRWEGTDADFIFL